MKNRKINIKNPKNAGVTFVELLLVLILLAGAFLAYAVNQREANKELNRSLFADQLVTIIKAFDQKSHVDGNLMKKPTNYIDDVVGRKGTAKEPTFWDNSDGTLLASATQSPGIPMLVFDKNVPTILNKLLVARGNATCGAGDGWIPVPQKESKTALIPCKVFSAKILWDLVPNLYLKYKDTPITPFNESTTPSNKVVNRYVTDIFLVFTFPTPASIEGKYTELSEMLDRMNKANRKEGSTGKMRYYFTYLDNPSGDPNARGLDSAVSPGICFTFAEKCLLVGNWSTKSDQENLRIDGMNSMINSSVTFKMGDNQKSNKALCNRFVKTTDENNDEGVPGDFDTDAPKSPWIYQQNVPCGIGIVTQATTSAHAPSAEQKYAVNSLSGSSNFKGLTLDQQCNNFELDSNNLIYTVSGKTPCGIIHNNSGGVDQIILYSNEIQAKEGIFGTNSTTGTGGMIHSRAIMIQESAILHDLGVQNSLNVQQSLHVIGSGKAIFKFSDDKTAWQNELAQMTAYCANLSSGVGTDKAIVAACGTLNSGLLNVSANTKIRGNLQLDGVLYQGAQDVAQTVTFNGSVIMGSNTASSNNYYVDQYKDNDPTDPQKELNTLCVGHDLLQGEDSCDPNPGGNPTGGDLNITATATAESNFTVGGTSPELGSNRYNREKAMFFTKGDGIVSVTKGWSGAASNAIGNNATNNAQEVTKLRVLNDGAAGYTSPESFDRTKNNDIIREEFDPETKEVAVEYVIDATGKSVKVPVGKKTFSFWSKTMLPTGLNIKRSNSCNEFQIGTIGQDTADGRMLTCVRIGSQKTWIAALSNNQVQQSSSSRLGQWDFCSLTTLGALKNSGKCELTYSANDPQNPDIRTWILSSRGRCAATCIGQSGAAAQPDTWNYQSTTCGYYNTPDRLPASSDLENPTDAQLGFIGMNNPAPVFTNPPYNSISYGYKINPTHDCTAWSPAPNTVNAGTIFTQTRTCQQDYQQQCTIYEQNQYGDVRIKNVGSGAFADSPAAGNDNLFQSPVSESQQAIGTRPFITP